jgi:hypothetical protein
MNMLSAFDDYCIHQTHEPIAKVAQSDRNFYDRYWFNGMDKNAGFCFEIGFGVYPNRFVMDGHFSVVIAGRQYSFHGSRRAPLDRTETVVGPLSIEVVAPMRIVRVKLAPNSTGIECDLIFYARTAASQEPQSIMHEGVHSIMQTTRFTQFGFWEGHISIDGKRTDVARATTFGTRDKSWGVRPVGEPQGGAPGLLNKEPGVYWVWSPLHFDNFCTQFGSFEDHDGYPTQLSACKVPTYTNVADVPIGNEPGHIEMLSMKHRIHWKKGTRHPQSAQFDFVSRDESGVEHAMNITLDVMQTFLMLGVGYQHPTWGHAVWKGDEVFEREEWNQAELDMMDYKHIHVHQMVKATSGNLTGYGILESVVFGRHAPSGFKEIFDPAV